MGSNAALMAARVIENTFEVLSVHALAIAEAIDCLNKADSLSDKTKEVYNGIRNAASKIESDLPRYKELAAIKQYLKTNNPQVI